jgi:outer membrane protein OmpA-like peptidoglycan-associated protein
MKTILITTSMAAMLLAATLNPARKVAPAIPVASTKIMKRAAIAALIKNMEYDNDRSLVRSKYYANLDQLAAAVKSEDFTISLKGHADSVGPYKYNWMLSDKRALIVKNYLVRKGVKADKIVTTPYGSTIPVASNKTEEGRQRNRRVEIMVQ